MLIVYSLRARYRRRAFCRAPLSTLMNCAPMNVGPRRIHLNEYTFRQNHRKDAKPRFKVIAERVSKA